jgi:hypothetical protein
MKSRDEIKKDILTALGNPESGLFVDYIDVIVNAVVGAENKSKDNNGSSASLPIKETRIIEAAEKR